MGASDRHRERNRGWETERNARTGWEEGRGERQRDKEREREGGGGAREASCNRETDSSTVQYLLSYEAVSVGADPVDIPSCRLWIFPRTLTPHHHLQGTSNTFQESWCFPCNPTSSRRWLPSQEYKYHPWLPLVAFSYKNAILLLNI